MKRIKIYFVATLLLLLGGSCESFLDKSPDMGLAEEDVYKNYASIRGLLDVCFTHLEHVMEMGNNGNGVAYVGLFADEMAAIDNASNASTLHSGNWLRAKKDETFELGVTGKTTISHCYQAIRIANRVLANYSKVPGMSDAQVNEIAGQAHFYRAWFYFQLMKRYGGMPKFDVVFTGDGDENIPRMTYHQSHDWMMEDVEAAIRMLPDMWDDANTGRPNKIAAMAFKSMAQLYDASPLMQNDLSANDIKNYDAERAEVAAKSAMEVLDYIEANSNVGCRLMTKEEYKNIFYFTAPPSHAPEAIWYNRVTNAMKRTTRAFWLYSDLAEGTGPDGACYCAPTQNMVDLFEKKGADGIYYPITDSRAGYDLQNPFEGRDPRFAVNILVPGEEWGVNQSSKKLYITTYVGGTAFNQMQTLKDINKRQQTGYLCKKFLWPEANRYTNGWDTYRVLTVYIRVAQIYLDLAEASFEATGSATAKVPGCKLSAEEALNIVRNRAGITDLPSGTVTDTKAFREALRRERAVELMFENHRWWDIRRWMIAHELFAPTYPIKGITATPKDPNHDKVVDKSKLKFTYEVVNVIPEMRNFTMRNYWYPFPKVDAAGVSNLQQNPGW